MAQAAPEQLDHIYTITEAAKSLGMKRETLLDQVQAGKVRAFKFGWFWLVPQEEVERIRAAQSN